MSTRQHLIPFTVLGMLLLVGCNANKLTTHAYKLQNTETDVALIHSVLEELWHEKSVRSHSEVKEDGYAVVRTVMLQSELDIS